MIFNTGEFWPESWFGDLETIYDAVDKAVYDADQRAISRVQVLENKCAELEALVRSLLNKEG